MSNNARTYRQVVYRQTLKQATQDDKDPVQLYVVEENSDDCTVTVYPLGVRSVERQHDGTTVLTLENDMTIQIDERRFDSVCIHKALNTFLNLYTLIFSDEDEAIRHANEVRTKRIANYRDKIEKLTQRVEAYEKQEVVVKDIRG